VTLLDGPPRLSDFDPPSLDRANVAALRSRITVAAAEPFASAYPRRYGSGLAARLVDGTELAVSVEDALGDPENPLSDAEIVRKGETLLEAAGMTTALRNALVRATLDLAEGGSLAGLTDRFPDFTR
jgi:2-methylcitrate dehydratase PrpD